MPQSRAVVVGASAGGVDALQTLVAGLPEALGAPVLVVLHISASAPSALASILARVTSLPVTAAVDGERLEDGHVYVAPPDWHMLVSDGRVTLARGPRENGHRPAIDPLFRSAARWAATNAIGVVLSGTLDDGAAGLAAIAGRGGRTLVQDPADAAYDGMPRAALAAVEPDAVVPAAQMAEIIAKWVAEARPKDPSPPQTLRAETDIAAFDEAAFEDPDRPGVVSGLICPDCGGSLFELSISGHVHYRCRVGHAWSPESLLSQQDQESESALWVAVRLLEERAALHRRLAAQSHGRGHRLTALRHDESSRDSERSARVIRDLLRSFVQSRAAVAESEEPG